MKMVATMQLVIMKKYKVSKALEIIYHRIEPDVGIEWKNTDATAWIDKIAKPATQAHVIFAHEKGGNQVQVPFKI